ncbi:MAG: M13 family metallopeptidase [Candidatus Aminicenantes bacterium]|nr:M13 family metallopeptidase [Candidatus Aminicenantes bacterium]
MEKTNFLNIRQNRKPCRPLTVTVTIVFFSLLLFSSCAARKDNAKPDALASHIDRRIRPGDDFFLYANGKWFKENPIPKSERSNGLWQLIQDTINGQVKNICESAAALKTVEKGTHKQKIGDFFYSGMDETVLNAHGVIDLAQDLSMIDAITDLKGVVTAVAYIQRVAGSPLFRFYVGQDDMLSSRYAIFINQGGLSLPERSFYFDSDPRAVLIRKGFVAYAGRLFRRLGYDEQLAQGAAACLMKMETMIAKASRKLEDTRDPLKNYNRLSTAELAKVAPGFDWPLFFKSVGLKAVDAVVVGQPEFLQSLYARMDRVALDDWKDYLKFHLVNNLAEFMDDDTYREFFQFYGATMEGVPEPKPRWKRVVEQTENSLGELIGQVYVAEYLPPRTKEKLIEIGEAIRSVYAERIKALDWMSSTTKEKALEKLSTVIMKIGYPDHWKNLSALAVDRTSYVRNVMNANAWHSDYNLAKFGKPVDRSEWEMTPQTYNAYYNPSNNEIVIPGSNIIVPGYEKTMADDAILYAIIGGSTVGHEIIHGFDDQGCKYDELGNLNNWWTAEDSAKFLARTRMIVEQFNEYNPVDDLHINGEMTQGENIADLAGITMGYEAFKKTRQFREKKEIAGLGSEKRFFLGYALGWMINQRPEGIANQVKSDVHSPAKYRVNGPLSDLTPFYEAFQVTEKDRMWRPLEKRVKIW